MSVSIRCRGRVGEVLTTCRESLRDETDGTKKRCCWCHAGRRALEVARRAGAANLEAIAGVGVAIVADEGRIISGVAS